MKLNNLSIDNNPGKHVEINLRVAYNRAGQATAIHFGNLRKQLPPVYFQLTITPQELDNQKINRFADIYCKHNVNMEGGRLIQILPMSIVEATQNFTRRQQVEYQSAFEADIVNILAGTLAEAKYVASRSNVPFDESLIDLPALGIYGGRSDFELINQYMQCFMGNNSERKRKLKNLLLMALSLINDSLIWRKTKSLAEFIQKQPEGTIPCEDLISFLDSDISLRLSH